MITSILDDRAISGSGWTCEGGQGEECEPTGRKQADGVRLDAMHHDAPPVGYSSVVSPPRGGVWP